MKRNTTIVERTGGRPEAMQKRRIHVAAIQQALARQIAKCLSRPSEEGALLRLGNRQGIDLPHQQPGNPSAYRSHALQDALAHRAVLPVDQTTSAHQALLRHKSQRSEDADMDRCGHLSDGRDHSQADETAGHTPQNFAAFERSSF